MLFLLLLLKLLPLAASGAPSSCTFEGFYHSPTAATTTPCPQAAPCEPGFYCTGGRRLPCPAGTYGDRPQLRTRSCAAPCPAGHFCPEGSAEPRPCGGAEWFCPLGSAAPRAVAPGYRGLGQSPERRDRIAPCARGTYCLLGTPRPCPAGVYGANTGLATPGCSAPCPAGHFCPKGSAEPRPCPAGTYGASTGLTEATCSGLCPVGHACPEGTIAPRLCVTGEACAEGQSQVTPPPRVDPGAYGPPGTGAQGLVCPRGAYCPEDRGRLGLAVPCPAGTFGADEGLTNPTCSGPCAPGFYCPRGSTQVTAVACGGPSVFCPEGSARPTAVSPGHYTIGSTSRRNRPQDPTDAAHRDAEVLCEPGHYCVDGERRPCPAGTFGDVGGLTTAACSGACAAGFYCPEGSRVARARRCGASDVFCPEGSAQPTPVSPGHCSTPEEEPPGGDPRTRVAQRPARRGEFADRGRCFPCPAGTFGTEALETRRTCSGPCAEGYFCPVGSTRQTARECGGPGVFCPVGSTAPLAVDAGFYTSRGAQEPCPPGRYREMTTTASAFLDVATGRSLVAVNYGDALFPLAACVPCPLGTFKPTAGDAPALCRPCPPLVATATADRRWCACFRPPGGAAFDSQTWRLRFDGETCELVAMSNDDDDQDEAARMAAAANGSALTRARQMPCESGFFCQNGQRTPCPAGTYGAVARETRAQCSGPCAAGFYCPAASTTATARRCGDPSVFCPEGSGVPRAVTPGYYTIRSPVATTVATAEDHGVAYRHTEDPTANATAATRDAQRPCEPGFFCMDGQRRPCPGGRYGDQPLETSPLCAGPCRRGHYCPLASTTATARACGADASVCRTGATRPEPVPVGYYSVGGTNATRFHQRPCEPGYFCVAGVRYQCPEGTFGATPGLASPRCSGPCRAGYACPSHPFPPSTTPTARECGGVGVFCPEGTGNRPRAVRSGFYTVGAGDGTGDARNTTRMAELVCPRGFFCRGGRRFRCPEGTFGDREGLSSAQCVGWCPAGFACPPGTTEAHAHPCPVGTYAPRGSPTCMPCDGGNGSGAPATIPEGFDLVSDEQRRRPCTDRRECCFFG